MIQLKGQDFQDEECGSWYNPQEVLIVCFYLKRLLKSGVKPEDIGLKSKNYFKLISKLKTFFSDFIAVSKASEQNPEIYPDNE